MSRGDRRGELITPQYLRRSASYMNQNISSEDINELAKAVDNSDLDAMREIIERNAQEDHIRKLIYVDSYNMFVEQLSEELITLNRFKLGEDRYVKAQAGAYNPIVDENAGYATTLKIRQKQKSSNKEYERSKPIRFSRTENLFFKRNINLSLKDIQVKFNQIFPKRTKSSIATKYYRSRKS